MKEERIEDPVIGSNDKDDNPLTYSHSEKPGGELLDVEGHGQSNLSAVFENPLAGIPREQLFRDVKEFCKKFDLLNDLETFKKGALVSQNPDSAIQLPELDENERKVLIREHTHKWSQPWQLYFLASESTSLNAYHNVVTSTNLSIFFYVQLCVLSLLLCREWTRQSIMVPKLSTWR